jgi:paraquat-inducible protein B
MRVGHPGQQKSGSALRAIRYFSVATASALLRPALLIRKSAITYQLFINAQTIAWSPATCVSGKNSGIAVDLTHGNAFEMGSLSTLFGGGVSFDVPEGNELGEPVAEKTAFMLYDDQRSIQESLYTEHIDYLMFFKDSIRGLQPGARSNFAVFAWVPWRKCRSSRQKCVRN